MYRVNLIYAPLAQLVEQLTLNQWVLGSSPRWCTTKQPYGKRKAVFFNDCRILAADLDKSQRLILYFERNSRTFSVMETVAYMQLPIKVSSKIIS